MRNHKEVKTAIESEKQPKPALEATSKPVKKPKNSFKRMHSPEKVGHVLVELYPDNTALLKQYTEENNPLYRQVILKTPPSNKHKPTFYTPNGNHPIFTLEACTPNGTILASSRSVMIENKIAKESSEMTKHTRLFFLSPVDNKKRKRETELGSTTPQANSEDTSLKGGELIKIKLHKRHRASYLLQHQVMSKTAQQELLASIIKYENDPSMKSLLKSLVGHPFEWLHCLAFSLCPKQVEPQVPENLAAGPKWINTYMMVLEDVAKKLATLYPGAVSVKPTFIMLPDTQLVDEINYEVTVEKETGTVKVANKVKALRLATASNLPSTTDAEQVKTVILALLNQKEPSMLKKLNFN
jgi:hypothetical protein